MSDILPVVTIYTDGACSPNPGRGGYAALLLFKDKRKTVKGGRKFTTNNRMEIMGAIAGLSFLKFPCQVTIYSDSQYLVSAMEKKWAVNWRKRGWTKKKKSAPVLNVDLWIDLLGLCENGGHKVKFFWVKGHSGDKHNEYCDDIAETIAREITPLPADESYEQYSKRKKSCRQSG